MNQSGVIHRFTRMALALATTALVSNLVFAEPAGFRPDLAGVVMNTSGVPIQNASVFIFTAGPRVGPGIFCPSCYPDCRKRASTGPDGVFKIAVLDPKLLFRVLVVAPGHQPLFVTKVDPLAAPLSAKLAPRIPGDTGPKQRLTGRVVDEEGQPVPFAVVNFKFYHGEKVNCGGQCPGVDPLAVTDETGQFLLATKEEFDRMSVQIEARGFAQRHYFNLASGRDHSLKLTPGAFVSGRVVKDGLPLKGISVGLVSVDRAENFTGDFTVATDDEGRFSFANVPPYQSYHLYGPMESLRSHGSLRVQRVRVGADGSDKQTGDLVVEPGLHITGQVVTSDGRPLPPHTKIILGRGDAWDSLTLDPRPDGTFTLAGLAPGPVTLAVVASGYRFTEKNKSLDRLNGGNLTGTLEQDLTGLRIELEPGKFVPPDFNRPGGFGPEMQPHDQPLRGAESPAL